nr:uncharacterized protein LOC132422476 [Delphinus delphis]
MVVAGGTLPWSARLGLLLVGERQRRGERKLPLAKSLAPLSVELTKPLPSQSLLSVAANFPVQGSERSAFKNLENQKDSEMGTLKSASSGASSETGISSSSLPPAPSGLFLAPTSRGSQHLGAGKGGQRLRTLLWNARADTRRSQWRKVTREPSSAAAFPVTQRHQVEAKEAETKKTKQEEKMDDSLGRGLLALAASWVTSAEVKGGSAHPGLQVSGLQGIRSDLKVYLGGNEYGRRALEDEQV